VLQDSTVVCLNVNSFVYMHSSSPMTGEDFTHINFRYHYIIVTILLILPIFMLQILFFSIFRHFHKIVKVTFNFIMSVCKKQLSSHWTDFHEI